MYYHGGTISHTIKMHTCIFNQIEDIPLANLRRGYNNDDEIEKEGDVMEEDENKIVHITVNLKNISSSSPTTFFKTTSTIKTEGKKLEVF